MRLQRGSFPICGDAVVHNDSPEPSVHVTIDDAGTNRYRLLVADDGPGISHQERQVILSGNEQALHHGSGLGSGTSSG